MHFIWVQTNELKYSLEKPWIIGKQKAIGIVKTFKYSEFKLLDGILHIELFWIKQHITHQNYTNFFAFLCANIGPTVVSRLLG